MNECLMLTPSRAKAVAKVGKKIVSGKSFRGKNPFVVLLPQGAACLRQGGAGEGRFRVSVCEKNRENHFDREENKCMFMHSLVEVGGSRCRDVFFVLPWRETGRQGGLRFSYLSCEKLYTIYLEDDETI